MRSQLIPLVVAVIAFARADAQPVADHLKCYKVKDPQPRASYTADLGGLVAEPGCTIRVPAVMACVPATKTNVTPTPPGGGGTGMPNAFGCYKIKCPRPTLPAFQLNDQFGNRSVTPSAPKLLCAPVAPPTTTTTTTTSTTTTNLPVCGPGDQSCGSCGDGVCLANCSPTGLPVCTGTPVGDFCFADTDCASGQVCTRVTPSSCLCRTVCP